VRRTLLVLLTVVTTVMCWSLPAGDAGAASPSRVYVALGDSVTQFGSATGLRYPERFFAFLQQAGAADTLQNIGVSGETSSSILGNQLTRALQLINDTGTNTTVVTLDIGGNDILGDPSCDATSSQFSLAACQPALSAFATNYRSLLGQLDTALAKDPGPHQVIVMAYYNPSSGRPGEETTAANTELALLGSDKKVDCAGQGMALGLNDLIACIGAQHGARLADVYPSFVGKGSQWFADQVHPNDAGHAAIASVFADVFGAVAHSTSTSVRCSPFTFAPGDATVCTTTVTDTASSGQSTPTGTVSFTHTGAGSVYGSPCTLKGSGGSASCAVFFTSFPRGGQAITASYGGDATHTASVGRTLIAVVLPASRKGCLVFGHGRITAANGDQASFRGLVFAKPSAGAEFYRDNGPAKSLWLRSLSVDAVTCSTDASRASVFGKAKLNGTGSVEYRIDIQVAAWERGKDTYRIRLSNGYDSGAQQIHHGDVDIHLRHKDHHHHDANAHQTQAGPRDGG
jgi:lysophospholipase L1-like esterase